MKMWSNHILVALAFSAASSVAIAAQDTKPSAGEAPAESGGIPSFSQIDADNSGFIEPEEAQGVTGLDMERADADNDGAIGKEEFEYAKRNLMPTKGEMNLPGTGKPNVPADVEEKKQ